MSHASIAREPWQGLWHSWAIGGHGKQMDLERCTLRDTEEGYQHIEDDFLATGGASKSATQTIGCQQHRNIPSTRALRPNTALDANFVAPL
jgi:hypothetical protein